jgi:hypothetical protein
MEKKINKLSDKERDMFMKRYNSNKYEVGYIFGTKKELDWWFRNTEPENFICGGYLITENKIYLDINEYIKDNGTDRDKMKRYMDETLDIIWENRIIPKHNKITSSGIMI